MKHDDEGLEQYAIVANRRQQWDVLLWQMPTMALTGEAFLFTISLGASTAQSGRIIASTLALIVALASLHSLASHRVSELTESRWLREHEEAREGERIHGLNWRTRRQATLAEQLKSPRLVDRLVARLATRRSIGVWFWTMSVISVVAGGVLVIAAADPGLLAH